MTRNKSTKPFAVALKKDEPVVVTQELMDVLNGLAQKVQGSKVLNGGFDTLIEKVEKIEEQVESIHGAVYHPDDGLFARVKEIEHIKANAVNITKLESDVVELQSWHKSEEKLEEKEVILFAEQAHLVKLHADQLKDLVAFKSRICTIAKWLAVTICGGLLTGLGKVIYEFASGHITIH